MRNDGRRHLKWLWDKSLVLFPNLLKTVKWENLRNHLPRQTTRRLDFLEKLERLRELSLSTLVILGDSLES